jgi:DNA-binding NarL/FixJ family response regulator
MALVIWREETMANEIRIMLVDDHAVVRESVAERLQRELDFSVIGTTSDAEKALVMAAEHKPDVILMDISMPGLFSFEAARRLIQMLPNTRIIFLSAFTTDTYIGQALEIRAHGYLTKREPVDRVIRAIREVASGGAYFSEEIRSRIVVDATGAKLRENAVSRLSKLSRRELEMLVYIAKGHGKKEIATIAGRSVKTIDHHITRLMNKLDIHDRVELAKFAIREGIAESE